MRARDNQSFSSFQIFHCLFFKFLLKKGYAPTTTGYTRECDTATNDDAPHSL
jgi:hypothetical protein